MSMCINQIEKSYHWRITPRIKIKQEINVLASQKDKFHMTMPQLRSAQLSSVFLTFSPSLRPRRVPITRPAPFWRLVWWSKILRRTSGWTTTELTASESFNPVVVVLLLRRRAGDDEAILNSKIWRGIQGYGMGWKNEANWFDMFAIKLDGAFACMVFGVWLCMCMSGWEGYAKRALATIAVPVCC